MVSKGGRDNYENAQRKPRDTLPPTLAELSVLEQVVKAFLRGMTDRAVGLEILTHTISQSWSLQGAYEQAIKLGQARATALRELEHQQRDEEIETLRHMVHSKAPYNQLQAYLASHGSYGASNGQLALLAPSSYALSVNQVIPGYSHWPTAPPHNPIMNLGYRNQPSNYQQYPANQGSQQQPTFRDYNQQEQQPQPNQFNVQHSAPPHQQPPAHIQYGQSNRGGQNGRGGRGGNKGSYKRGYS